MGSGWQVFSWCVTAAVGGLLLLRLSALGVAHAERALNRLEQRERRACARRREAAEASQEPAAVAAERA